MVLTLKGRPSMLTMDWMVTCRALLLTPVNGRS
jgi:hypothetical protein